MAKKKIVRRNWERVYEEYLNSGMSVSGFARSKGIPLSSFRGFLYRSERPTVAETRKHDVTEFVPVAAIPTDVTHCNTIAVSIGKATITVDKDTDMQLLEKILKVVALSC